MTCSLCSRSAVSARAKAGTQLLREQGRLLEGREVAAAIELVPVDEIGVELLGPAARRREDLAGKQAASHRYVFDLAAVEADLCVLEVDPRRGGGCSRQPVERDVVEHRVARERVLEVAVMVGPGVKLFVDPGGLTHR
jgi:hypothetical protein